MEEEQIIKKKIGMPNIVYEKKTRLKDEIY